MRIVSPASPPDRAGVERGAEVFSSWGLRVEFGTHVFDRWGYLAGRDEQRAADLNDALADPGVRAVFASRGGKGAYRITELLETAALQDDPKPLVGFSDITHLHLALWSRCGLAGLHGPFANWDASWSGPESARALRNALMTTDPVTVRRDPGEPSAAVTVEGTARGTLLGGNLDAVRSQAGAGLPSLAGAILFLEHQRGTGLGEVDRALTQLSRCAEVRGLRGVVLGQFPGFERDHGDPSLGGWEIADVLRDRLSLFGVPVLGGIPAGHRFHPPTIPLGTEAVLDTRAGTLTVAAAVR